MSMYCFFSRPTPFSVIPHSSVDYHQVFRLILYFQPSPLQSDSQLYTLNPFESIGIQFFNSHMWLTGRHATPEVTLPHPTLYLGKRRISPGVIGILSMYLHLHTYFTYHQKVYTGKFYLRLSSATICEESALREVWTHILKVMMNKFY